MNTPTLSIIIVSYNTVAYITRALTSVYQETPQTNFEVIVVDNASTDDSVAVLNRQFPQIKLIQSKQNLGFAGGVRLGVEQACGEYLLLLNPDTAILNQAIDKLVSFAQQYPNNGIWGGVTLNNDLSLNSQHAWEKPTFKNLLFSALGLSKTFNTNAFFNSANYGAWQRDSIKTVDILSGCFFLTTRQLWTQLGGLDASFFMYAEEADYCLKAKALGYQPIVTPDARIIHHGGVSHSHFSGKMIKLLKGKVELIHRHIPAYKRPLYKALLSLYVWNKHIQHKLLKAGTEAQREWQTVIDQRANWQQGYH
jgi:hypothetical protein